MFSIIEWHFLISERFLKLNSCNYITEFNISIRSYIYVVKHNRFSIFAAYPRLKKFIFTGALSNNRKSGRQNIHVFVFKSSLRQHAICCWDWLKKHSFLLPRKIDCILKMRQIRDSNASSERKRIWRKDPAKSRKLIWQRLVPTMSANCGRSSNLCVGSTWFSDDDDDVGDDGDVDTDATRQSSAAGGFRALSDRRTGAGVTRRDASEGRRRGEDVVVLRATRGSGGRGT